MDGDPFDLVGDVIDGQFRVDAVAGEGDLSVVYRGWHTGVAATVAIKCLNLPTTLDPKLVEPFVQSFREGTKLHYRLARGNLNIAQSLASGTTLAPRTGQLVPYLVREWFEGHSLAAEFEKRRASKGPPWTLEQAIDLLDSAADALAYAHAQKESHQSINPSNLFVVTGDPKRTVVKLLDFGVAKVLNEQGGQSAGLRVLMPQYASPEQIERQIGAPGPWTDVYSLALVVMEALAGKPVIASKEGAPAAQIDPDHRPSVRAFGVHLPKAAEDVLTRAVALKPTSRFADAGAFWSALKEAGKPAKPVGLRLPPSREMAKVSPPAEPRPPVPPALPATPAAPLAPAAPAAPASPASPASPAALAALAALAAPVKTPAGPTPAIKRVDDAPKEAEAAAALPRPFSITRRTIAGLGGERLPVPPPLATMPKPEPLPSAPAELPVPIEPAEPVLDLPKVIVAQSPPPPPMPPAPAIPPPAPAEPSPEVSVPASTSPEASLELMRSLGMSSNGSAQAVSTDTVPPRFQSLAPASGLRKLRSLVLVGIAGSMLALVALVGLAVYVVAATRATPRNVASVAVSVPPPSAIQPPAPPPETTSPPPPAASALPPSKRFTRAAGLAALDEVNASLASCGHTGGLWGVGSIRVTFGGDGTVAHLSLGPPFAGTPEGTCIADRFRGARMNPFKGPPGALNYNFTLPQGP